MSTYSARILWQRGEQVFCDRRYSRAHRLQFDGGVDVPGSSSPQVVPLPYSDAAAVDPEEMFVASLSSCHMLWFLHLAGKAGWVVDDYQDDAVGVMARNAAGRMAITAVTLRPAVRFAGTQPTAEQQFKADLVAECRVADPLDQQPRLLDVRNVDSDE